MWVNWRTSERTVGSPRAVGMHWATDQGNFRGLTSLPGIVSNSFWWPQRTTTARGRMSPTDVNACGRAGWCRCSRNFFGKDWPYPFTLLGCCFILLVLLMWNALLLSFKMLYGNTTHFLEHSMRDYCFFATELIRYNFKFYFSCAFMFVAFRVWVTVDDWYFQFGHWKKGAEYCTCECVPAAKRLTVTHSIIGILIFWFYFANSQSSMVLKWLSILIDIPCSRRCVTAVRHLPHKHAALFPVLCVPWVVGHFSQATAGCGCALSNSIPSAFVCSPGSKNSAQPWEERDCHNNWVACGFLCHRLLRSLGCFRWSWNQSNWLHMQSD